MNKPTKDPNTTRARMDTSRTIRLPGMLIERRDRTTRCASERHVKDGQEKRSPCPDCRKPTPRRSRAAVLVAAILVLSAINLAFVGAVTATSDDARIAVHRAATTRAFFAAESALETVIGELSAGRDLPVGTVSLPGGETLSITTSDGSPTPTPPFTADVRGQYDQAVRSIQLSFE